MVGLVSLFSVLIKEFHHFFKLSGCCWWRLKMLKGQFQIVNCCCAVKQGYDIVVNVVDFLSHD